MKSHGYFKEVTKGVWRCKVYLGKDPLTGKKKYHNFTVRGSERTVRRIVRDTAFQLKQSKIGTAEAHQPFKDYLDFWMKNYVEVENRPSTVANYGYIINKHIVPDLGRIPLDELNWKHIQELVNRKKKEQVISVRTIHLIHAIIHAALNQAIEWEYIEKNPAAKVTLPPKVKKRVRPLTAEQAMKFLEAAMDSRFYAAFVLATVLGLRRGEILGLEWKNIDLQEARLDVVQSLVVVRGKVAIQPPKTESSFRSLGIPPEVITVLKAHRTRQLKEKLLAGEGYQDHDLVFPTEIGTPMNPRNFILRYFKPLLVKADLPPTIRFHDLRHTCASLMIKNNESIKVIAENLGHDRTAQATETYIHLMPKMQAEAAARVAGLILDNNGLPKRKTGSC